MRRRIVALSRVVAQFLGFALSPDNDHIDVRRATLLDVTEDEPTFETLKLWSADTLVLFDWLMTVDFDALPITHRAQRQALMDLLTSLEADTRATQASKEEIGTAQERVAREMG
jgi:hypothetical protein